MLIANHQCWTMKKYVRTIHFSEKDQMILKLSELRVVAFAQFVRKSEKIIATSWILSTENYFSQRNQMAITLSQLAKNASNVPSFTFTLRVHRQTNCRSELFFWNPLSELCLRYYDSCNHLWLLNNEQVQNIEKSKASIVVVVSCFATAQARIQVRQSEIYISS